MLRIDVRPALALAEEEAGLHKRTRSRALRTDPDRGPLYHGFCLPLFRLWKIFEGDRRGRWGRTTRAARSPLCRHILLYTTSPRSCIGEGKEVFWKGPPSGRGKRSARSARARRGGPLAAEAPPGNTRASAPHSLYIPKGAFNCAQERPAAGGLHSSTGVPTRKQMATRVLAEKQRVIYQEPRHCSAAVRRLQSCRACKPMNDFDGY